MADSKLEASPWLRRLAAEPAEYSLIDIVDLASRLGVRARLFHSTSLGFARGEAERVKVTGLPDAPELSILASCFGLTGATTPLPLTYAEEADWDDEPATVVREFLDLFNEPLLELLVACVRELDHPRVFRADGADSWTRAVLAYLDAPGWVRALTPAHLLRLAPILAAPTRSASALEAAMRIVLAGWLARARAVVESFAGDWTELDDDEHTRLGAASASLGKRFLVGTAVRHRAGAARIVVGPLTSGEHHAFIPGGLAYARLCELVALFLRTPLRVELELEIDDPDETPGGLGEGGLGGTLWLARSERSTLQARLNIPLVAPAGEETGP